MLKLIYLGELEISDFGLSCEDLGNIVLVGCAVFVQWLQFSCLSIYGLLVDLLDQNHSGKVVIVLSLFCLSCLLHFVDST